MKIFGKTIFENKKTATEVVSYNDGKMSFSTPFFKIGKGDLGKPFISTWYTVSGIVQFGTDNLYPQVLDQMYYTSPMHSGCLEFISRAAIGGGYEYKIPPVTGVETVDLYTFEKKNKFKNIFRYLPIDFLIHKRVCFLIRKDKNGKFISMKKLNPATIRNNQTLDKFVYCLDWSRRTDLIQYNKYTPNGKDAESIWVYQAETVGQDTYPLPSYISVLNDVFLDGEISYLQKSNIQNSIWPSLSIRVPKMFESDEERERFKQGLIDNSGASGAGKIIIMQGQGFDNTPEVTSIPTNQNDKLFDSTIENILNKICFAHGINPSIMGIKVAGSLGNSEELQMSYSIFEKNVIMPLRSELTDIYDELLDIAGVKNSIVINDFQIIEKAIVPGQEKAMQEEQELSAETPEEEQLMTNAAITNMTGRHQQQLLRIIRQYGQGKINKKQASVLLRTGLGLKEEDINLMLQN
jgi:hypothetical protein